MRGAFGNSHDANFLLVPRSMVSELTSCLAVDVAATKEKVKAGISQFLI